MQRKIENIDLSSAIASKNIDRVNAAIEAGSKASSGDFFSALATDNASIILAVIGACDKPYTRMLYNAMLVTKNITIVNAIIKTGAEASSEDLDLALKIGNIQIINAVIDAGAPPYDLYYPILTNNLDIVKLAIKRGAKISSYNFISACIIENVAIVNAIIDAGFQPELASLWMLVTLGHTAIITATKAASCDSIKDMIEIAKMNPNNQNMTNFLDKLTIKTTARIFTQVSRNQTGFFATLPPELLVKIACLTGKDGDNKEDYKLAYDNFNS